MKFIEIKPGKSLNILTGEEWRKCDAVVLVEEGETPSEVYKKAMEEIDGWLPSGQSSNTIPVPRDIYFNVTTQKEEK